MWLFFNAVTIFVNRYYHDIWLNENISRQALHQDEEISSERSVWKDTILTSKKDGPWVWNMLDFQALWVLLPILILFEIEDLWIRSVDRFFYGSSTPNLQVLTLKRLGQPCSSSCCEKNWSTYSFIHSLKRNKLTGTDRKSSVCA